MKKKKNAESTLAELFFICCQYDAGHDSSSGSGGSSFVIKKVLRMSENDNASTLIKKVEQELKKAIRSKVLPKKLYWYSSGDWSESWGSLHMSFFVDTKDKDVLDFVDGLNSDLADLLKKLFKK